MEDKKSLFVMYKSKDKDIIVDKLNYVLPVLYGTRYYVSKEYTTFDENYTILVFGLHENDIDLEPMLDYENNIFIGKLVYNKYPPQLYKKVDYRSSTKQIFRLFTLGQERFEHLEELGIFGYGIMYNPKDKRLMVKTILSESYDLKLNYGIVDGKAEIYSNSFDVLSQLCSGNFDSIDDGYYENNYTLDGRFIMSKNMFGGNDIERDRLPHLSDFDGGIYLTDEDYSSDPAIGRDEEIRELMKCLLIPKKGVLLVGSSGIGKTSIVEGLAYRIRNYQVCDEFKKKSILSVSSTELLAGTRYRGDFEDKIVKLFNSLYSHKDIILFLDEMHTVLNTNKNDEDGVSLANMLKPYISSGRIKLIGCTTSEEYKSFCVDPAFERRFKVLDVKEQNDDIIKSILVNYILDNDFNIDINMTDDEINKLLDIIIKLSKRKRMYTNVSLKNPDASINILMSAFTYMVIENIKHAKLKDFIDGILDDSSLSLMDIDRQLLLKEFDSSKDDSSFNRGQIKMYIKK